MEADRFSRHQRKPIRVQAGSFSVVSLPGVSVQHGNARTQLTGEEAEFTGVAAPWSPKPFTGQRFKVEFPQLDTVRDKMSVGFEIIRREAHFPPAVLQNEEYLPIERRGDVEVVHRFIPHRHLGAWHVATLGPGVRFAFHENWRVSAAEVEAVHLLGFTDPDRHREVLHQRDALPREKRAGGSFEVVACLRIAYGADPLKIVVLHGGHPLFLRFAARVSVQHRRTLTQPTRVYRAIRGDETGLPRLQRGYAPN